MNANGGRRSPVPTPTVTVCRGCCCGSDKKHPDLDHSFQVHQLRAAVGNNGRVRVVDECLGACEQSNVMVVMPSSPGRARGGRPTWLGSVMDDAALVEIADWIAAGGPGLATVPRNLDASTFSPPSPATQTAAGKRTARAQKKPRKKTQR